VRSTFRRSAGGKGLEVDSRVASWSGCGRTRWGRRWGRGGAGERAPVVGQRDRRRPYWYGPRSSPRSRPWWSPLGRAEATGSGCSRQDVEGQRTFRRRPGRPRWRRSGSNLWVWLRKTGGTTSSAVSSGWCGQQACLDRIRLIVARDGPATGGRRPRAAAARVTRSRMKSAPLSGANSVSQPDDLSITSGPVRSG